MDIIPLYLPNTQGANSTFARDAFLSPGVDCTVPMGGVLHYYGITVNFGRSLAYLAAYFVAVLALGLLSVLVAGRRERR